MRLGSIVLEQEDMLLNLINEFIYLKETQGREGRTVKDYKKELMKFYNSSSKKVNEDSLREDVLFYFSTIPTTSSAVFNRPYSCLCAFFNYLVRKRYLPINPLIDAEIKKKKDDSYITSADMEDVKKLMGVCDKRSYTGYRNYCIILLMIDTGIRTSELVRLRDCDFERDKIVIRPEICKTHSSRILYLSPSTSSAIGKLIKVKNGFGETLFSSREGRELDTNELSREFRKLSCKAGVKITPYQLRHTFATICVKNGINVFLLQQLMGHSDIAMTRRYTDINGKDLEKAHSSFSPISLLEGNKRLGKI